MREKLLKEKAEKITQELARWAKRNKILRPGEHIVFSLRIDAQPIVLQKKTEKAVSDLDTNIVIFFTKERLISLGMPPQQATRAIGMIRNCTYKREVVNGKEVGETTFGTVGDFLAKYQHESQFRDFNFRRKNFGKMTAHSLAEALRKAGLWA